MQGKQHGTFSKHNWVMAETTKPGLRHYPKYVVDVAQCSADINCIEDL